MVVDEELEGPLREEDDDIDMQYNNHNNSVGNRNRNYKNRNNRRNDNNNNHNNNDTNSESASPNTKKKRNYTKKKKETMTDDQKYERQEKCKMTVAKTVNELIEFNLREWNVENNPDNDEDLKMKASKQFVFGLTELVYDTAVVIANDLEAFRKHKGKKTVMVDDFLLFCRRNKDMKQQMCQHFTQMNMGNND